MPVDVRCNMICSLGTVIRGQLSDSLMTEGGLITTTGTIEIAGINLPARGAEVQLAYHRPQNNTITRFPRRLRVLGATADPYRGITKVEVGCKLALQMDLRKRTDRFLANTNTTTQPTPGDVASYLESTPPIRAQAVLLDCLGKVSIQLASGSQALVFSFLEKDIDLSQGYLRVVDGLLKSEACFGYLTMDEKLMIQRVNLTAASSAAVLRDDDLIDLRPMEGAEEPADRALVSYEGTDPGARTPPDGVEVGGAVDWTFDEVFSDPGSLFVNYTDFNGDQQKAEFVDWSRSSTTTTYATISYTTKSGEADSEDVATLRESRTLVSQAAANSAAIAWKLGRIGEYSFGFVQGGELVSGTAERRSRTDYLYEIGDNGPSVSQEKTSEYISELELAGSLNITDYTDLVPLGNPVYDSSSLLTPHATILSSQTIVNFSERVGADGRTYTKSVTTRYMAYGLTQEGQQSAAEQLAQGVMARAVMNSMTRLVCDGAEVRSSIGRAPTPARPSGSELVSGYINNGGQSSVEIIFRYASDSETTVSRIDSYSLPYSPDSTYTGSFSFPAGSQVTWNSVSSLFTGAADAARNYGLMMNALKAGYAYGFNITTSCDRLPTTPFAPLYINAAGLSVAVRLNGVSWAFDGSGLVASTDLMLCGVAGAIGPVTSSWVRLPVGVENLPVLSPPTENTTPSPGSTITAPPGFDPTNPGDVFTGLPADNNDTPGAVQDPGGVVPPFLTDEEVIGRSRHLVVISELPYEVQPVAEEAVLITKHRATADVQLTLEVPVATLALATYAPAVATGAAVQVPAASLALVVYPPAIATGAAALAPAAVLTLAAHAPAIATGASVVAPAASLVLTAHAPDAVGPAGVRLEPPVAALSLAAHTPAVSTGASVAAPAAALTLTARTPSVSTGASVAVPAAALTLTAQAPDVTIVVPPVFKAITYSGTGAAQSIAGVGFKPGIVITRRRGTSPGAGPVFDYSRTVDKYWDSTSNGTEQTSATQLTSLNADGFTLGTGAITNLNGSNSVAWCWKEGAAAATDTSGTISSTVYANTGGGFSIIRYTGNGTAGATIGHGLGVAPDLVLIKALGTTDYAYVGGVAAGDNNYMLLSLNQQLLADNRFLRTFSSSTITLGSGGGVNTNGTAYIAYAFASKAGVSKAGTYTGGGATAVTVDCGFAPELLLVKSTGTGNWMWFDTARGETKQLLQSSGAETTVDKVTLGASGFTAKANADANTASTSFIYLAFA